MAKTHYKALLGKVLSGFLTADDPVQAILEWVAHQMMLIEAENKVGAEKGQHSKERKTYFSGGPGEADGHAPGDDLSVHPEAPEGRIFALFRDLEETLRDGFGGAGPGSLHQRGLDASDRAAGPGSWC
jgi:hypothetical protein